MVGAVAGDLRDPAVHREERRRRAEERRQRGTPVVSKDVHHEETVFRGRVPRAELGVGARCTEDVRHAEVVPQDHRAGAWRFDPLGLRGDREEACVLVVLGEVCWIQMRRDLQQVRVHRLLVLLVRRDRAGTGLLLDEVRGVHEPVVARRDDVEHAAARAVDERRADRAGLQNAGCLGAGAERDQCDEEKRGGNERETTTHATSGGTVPAAVFALGVGIPFHQARLPETTGASRPHEREARAA